MKAPLHYESCKWMGCSSKTFHVHCHAMTPVQIFNVIFSFTLLGKQRFHSSNFNITTTKDRCIKIRLGFNVDLQ